MRQNNAQAPHIPQTHFYKNYKKENETKFTTYAYPYILGEMCKLVREDRGIKISNIRWQEDKNGIIKIYKDVLARRPYVIGGDTAGDGSDNFVGEVLDNISGEQVAELSHQTDEDLYARQMYCLGTYYNQALIGLEVNFSTYPEKELERLKKEIEKLLITLITTRVIPSEIFGKRSSIVVTLYSKLL